MAITNTVGEGGDIMKGAEGDRGGPKIFWTCEDCLK
jgi:hypothetical protein